MLLRRISLILVVIVAAAGALAQETPPPPPQTQPPTSQNPPTTTDQTPPTTNPAGEPSVLSGAASGSYERRDTLPYFNLYIPEGQASIRLRKLIKNVLFESQIDYRFINGDIDTFLRYKYYARNFTYKISVFDTIGFENLGQSAQFQRVRGGLFLAEIPRDYNNRYFWLLQDDRLTFGDVTQVDNRKNNIYTKIGYQYGTEFDEHMNAIVGESRGRIIPVLTAFRDIGPQKTSFAVALTEGARLATGDYRYTKFEAEALRRWDITPTSFIVTRAHAGIFPTKSIVRDWCTDQTNQVCGRGTPPPGAVSVPSFQRYSVPAYEMFDLGGREALLGVKSDDFSLGTSEFHLTNEYFVPVFRNRDYRTGIAHWNTVYGIGYVGVGNVGFNYSDAVKPSNYVVDVGLGAEASVTVRDFEVLLSIVYAHPLRAPEDLRGGKFHLSLRTIR